MNFTIVAPISRCKYVNEILLYLIELCFTPTFCCYKSFLDLLHERRLRKNLSVLHISINQANYLYDTAFINKVIQSHMATIYIINHRCNSCIR